jgi:HSP20 family protein
MASWDPFVEMEALRREIDRTFDQYGSGGEPVSRVVFLPGRAPRRYPLINLHEDKDNLYVEALAPGVEPNSWNLTVVRNQLTISGEKRRVGDAVKPEAFHRSERASGKFVRNVELPVEVDENDIKAEYKNGLLWLTLPKAEKAKPKQINVKVA